MLTITVSELAATSRYLLGTVSTYWNPGGTTGPVQYFDVPGYLVSITDYQPGDTFRYQLGRLSQSDRGPMGLLRDKGVRHTNISGALELVARSYVYDSVLMTGGTFPRAKRTGSSTYVPFTAAVDWGHDVGSSHTITWDPNSDSQGLFTRDAWLAQRNLWFSGDYMVSYLSYAAGDGYKNGSKYESARVITYLTLYQRRSGSLYSLKQLTATKVYTKGSAFDAFASYMGLAGSFLSPFAYDSLPVPGGASAAAYAAASACQSFDCFAGLIGDERAYFDFGDLTLECAQQMKYVDANLLMLAVDISEWRDLHGLWKGIVNADGWARAIKAFDLFSERRGDWKQFKNLFQPASSLYLWKSYAVEPNVDDGRRIFEGVRKLISLSQKTRVHSRRVLPVTIPDSLYGRLTAVLTVDVGTYPKGIMGLLQKMIGEAKKWGVYPNCTALADTVKYSFVVNWFIQFGDMLKDVDAYLDTENYFPVDHCIQSVKWEAGYDSSLIVRNACVTGTVVYSHYERWTSREVPLPSVSSLRLGSGPHKHGAEATALILQRIPNSLKNVHF